MCMKEIFAVILCLFMHIIYIHTCIYSIVNDIAQIKLEDSVYKYNISLSSEHIVEYTYLYHF